MDAKICTKCGENKNIDCFSPRENGKFASACKKCKASYRREKYKAKPKEQYEILYEKVCSICGELKSIEDFYKNSRCSTYRNECKECLKVRVLNYRTEIIELVRELKSKPCTDCGCVFPYYVMDFDHKEGHEKLFEISQMRRHSKELVLLEIQKCDLVCSNCHRIRTFNRLDKK